MLELESVTNEMSKRMTSGGTWLLLTNHAHLDVGLLSLC